MAVFFLAPHWSFHFFFFFLDLFLYFLWDPKNLGLLRPSFSSSMLVWFHSQPIYYCRLDLVVGWILFLAFLVPQKILLLLLFQSAVELQVRLGAGLQVWLGVELQVHWGVELQVQFVIEWLWNTVEMPDSCGVVVEPRIHGQMEGSCQRGLWQLLSNLSMTSAEVLVWVLSLLVGFLAEGVLNSLSGHLTTSL